MYRKTTGEGNGSDLVSSKPVALYPYSNPISSTFAKKQGVEITDNLLNSMTLNLKNDPT